MNEAFVYIGSRPKARSGFAGAHVVSSGAELSALFAGPKARQPRILVVSEPAGWRWLIDTLATQQPKRRWRGRVLGLASLDSGWAIASVLVSRFERFVRRPPVLLPLAELAEVLRQPHRGDLCIGGAVDQMLGMAVLVRGNLDVMQVPLTMFKPSGDGTEPDFSAFKIGDHGQTLRFGAYEASFDAVLYELDGEYRRRLRHQRRVEDQTFGAALRRLRIQRGVGRDEFAGVASKTIARIERGEVEKPHAETLQKIADRLGVSVDEIDDY